MKSPQTRKILANFLDGLLSVMIELPFVAYKGGCIALPTA